jgi:outer membrane biosynthesis protein TonB
MRTLAIALLLVSSTALAQPAANKVSPTAIEPNRTAGNKLIAPSEATKAEMTKSGKTKVTAAYKFCLSTAGEVGDIALIKSSGLKSYDTTIETELHNWRYKPYAPNGTPEAVCTEITIVYSQR